MPEKQFYRPDEVAKLLDVSTKTVLRAIKAGKIKVIVVGPHIYRIPKHEIAKYQSA